MSVGFNRTGICDVRYQRAMLDVAGTIETHGRVSIGAGSRIVVGKDAVLRFGGKVAYSAAVTIVCGKSMEIGGDTVISWDTLIMDTDYHYVMDTEKGTTRPMRKPIKIGQGTWLCAGSKVLKGAVLPDGCILSAGSVLSNPMEECDCLLVGNPAAVVKRNVRRSDKDIN